MIYRIVDQAFREELFKVSSNGYQPKYNGLQLINREVIANYLKQLLVIDSRQAPFTVIGLEIPIETRFVLPTSCGDKNLTLSGFIDRLDSVAANGKPGLENMAEKIRVIDYKTGRAPVSHPAEIAEVFNPEMLRKHTAYTECEQYRRVQADISHLLGLLEAGQPGHADSAQTAEQRAEVGREQAHGNGQQDDAEKLAEQVDG